MEYDYITKKADTLIRKYKTRDPYVIAKELGIHVIYKNNFNQLKGMYKVIQRNRFIFINSNMDDHIKAIVCAHEIGHDQLHREYASKELLSEFKLFKNDSKMEYEANLFSAELLLSSNDFLENINLGYDNIQIAKAMNSDINLIALKSTSLINQGYNLHKLEHKSNFLKY